MKGIITLLQMSNYISFSHENGGMFKWTNIKSTLALSAGFGSFEGPISV